MDSSLRSQSDNIKKLRRGMLTSGVLLLHDNVPATNLVLRILQIGKLSLKNSNTQRILLI